MYFAVLKESIFNFVNRLEAECSATGWKHNEDMHIFFNIDKMYSDRLGLRT